MTFRGGAPLRRCDGTASENPAGSCSRRHRSGWRHHKLNGIHRHKGPSYAICQKRPPRAAWNGFPNGCDFGHATGRSHRRRPPRSAEGPGNSAPEFCGRERGPECPHPARTGGGSGPRRPLPHRLAVESWRSSSLDSPICTARAFSLMTNSLQRKPGSCCDNSLEEPGITDRKPDVGGGSRVAITSPGGRSSGGVR